MGNLPSVIGISVKEYVKKIAENGEFEKLFAVNDLICKVAENSGTLNDSYQNYFYDLASEISDTIVENLEEEKINDYLERVKK